MVLEFRINGQQIDIDENIIMPLTYSVADIRHPDKRARNRSKTIKIKGTQNNLNVMFAAYSLSLEDVGVGFDFNPNAELIAEVKRKGYVVFSGVAHYMATTKSKGIYYFDFQIFGKSVGLFEKLGDMTLPELGWSEYDHDLTIANLELSWDTSVEVNGVPTSNFTAGGAPKGFGYVYPLINFGYAANQISPKTNELLPYFYVLEALRKCFAVGGYTITGTLFNSQTFKRLIFGLSGGDKILLTALQVQARLCHYDIPFSYSSPGIPPYQSIPQSGFWQHKYNWVGNFTIGTAALVDDDNSQFNQTAKKLTIAETGVYKIEFTINGTTNIGFTGSFLSVSVQGLFDISVYKNGTQIATAGELIGLGGASPSVSINIQSQLNAGDELEFKNRGVILATTESLTSGSTPPIVYYSTAYSAGTFFKLTAINIGLSEGDNVEVARWMPNIKCRDFVNSIITMCNLYMSEPDEDDVIRLDAFDYYYGSTADAENYTGKLDEGKDITITSSANIDGKVYKFRFAEDRDAYKLYYFKRWGIDYGDLFYDVPTTFKKGDKLYQLVFAQSVPVQVGDLVIPQIVTRDEITNVVTPYKGKPRIFIYNGLEVGDWDLLNSTTGAATAETSYPLAHHVNDVASPTFDLNFGVPIEIYYTTSAYTNINLYSTFWDIFIKELTAIDSKMLKAYFKINERDLQGDFMARLVNVNGVVYRKNLINDFDATGFETTKHELIKVLEARSPRISNTPPPRGKAAVGGMQNRQVAKTTEVSTTYTYDVDDGAMIFAKVTGGAFTITLPMDVSNGMEVTIQQDGGTGNRVTVVAASGNISGQASIVYANEYESNTFIYSSPERKLTMTGWFLK
jgi:hypothetical protein